MTGKLVFFVVLALCCAGAYWHMSGDPSALDNLMQVPSSFPARSLGGIEEMIPRGPPSEYCEDGRVTVFAFIKSRSGACRTLRRHIESFTKLRPDVAFRYIRLDSGRDYADYFTRHGIDFGKAPHVLIFDASCKLLAEDNGRYKRGLELLYKWTDAERGKTVSGSR